MNRWSIPLDRLAAKTGLDLDTVARKATADLFRAVVLRSPVDTGRFKGNWTVSKSSPDFSMSTREDKTPRGQLDSGSLAVVNKAFTLTSGGVVYLSNGLPYANRLEFGYSKQAPAGMVRLASAEFASYVRRATR